MSLRHSVFASAFCVLMNVSAPVWAIDYVISPGAPDAVAADGFCSLREAVQAASSKLQVNECPAGSGSDAVVLTEGEGYQLTAGELVLGGLTSAPIDTNEDGDVTDPEDIPAKNINPVLNFKVARKVFDDEAKINPVITASAGSRLFHVKSGATLRVTGVTLEGNGAVAGNGGLVLLEGNMSASDGAQLNDGAADNGGAIYVQGSGLLVLDYAGFRGNTSVLTGGALATDPAFSGTVTVARALFEDNVSGTDGGAISLSGANPTLYAYNSTFYANGSTGNGGAIALLATPRSVALNNITVAGQQSGGGLFFAPATDSTHRLTNSVVVGNVGGSCIGDPLAIDEAHIAYVVHQGGTCTEDKSANMPDPSGLPGDTIPNQSGAADFTVLFGDTDVGAAVTPGQCPPTDGAVCEPLEITAAFKGFLPDYTDSIGDPNDGVPSVINAGSPPDATSDFCETADQRGEDRDDDCDAGSLELRIAKGEFDEFFVVSGIASELDVVENDLGDLQISCPTQLCMEIVNPPGKGTASVIYTADNYPLVRYQSYPGIHGVDSFSYRIDRTAISGELTYADVDLGAQVNLVVEPAAGIQSESIGYGGTGIFSLVVMLAMVIMRRAKLLFALVFALPAVASAATITVNSLDDASPPLYNDGFCTIREALGNAFDDAPRISPDCAPGGPGKDIILLPEGTISLVEPLTIVAGSVEIEGAGAAVPGVTGTTIDGGGNSRIFEAEQTLTLRYMTLTGGFSTGRGGAVFTSASLAMQQVVLTGNQAQLGGAVYLNFGNAIMRSARFDGVEFSNNIATEAGGALWFPGQIDNFTIVIENSSFIGNQARTTAGAVDVNLGAGGNLAITNSTFVNNVATEAASNPGADALDFVGVTPGAQAYLINSTFVDHPTRAFEFADGVNIDTSGNGSFESDENYVAVLISNSVVVNSGSCSSSTGRFGSRHYTVFEPFPDGDPLSTNPTPPCSAVIEDGNAPTTLLPGAIDAVLNGKVIVAAAGEKEEFVVSHFPLVSGVANDGLLIDAGNGTAADLEEGTNLPQKCRATDLRGLSRTAGNRCDIGAYELERNTAVDDEAAQGINRGRFVIIDVLANDLTVDGDTIITDSIDLDPASLVVDLTATTPAQPGYPAGGSVRVVDSEDNDAACGVTDPANTTGQKCVVRYDAPPNLSCAQIKGFTDTFDYRFFTSPGDQPSVEGSVEVSLDNVRPKAPNVKVVSTPGAPVVMPFVIDDPDGAGITDITVSREPYNARADLVDGEWVYLGVGIIVDQAAGTVTYHPAGAKPFNEKFSLSYKDDCGGVGETTFEIQYPREDVSGDFVGSGSASLWTLLSSLILLARRRRPKS